MDKNVIFEASFLGSESRLYSKKETKKWSPKTEKTRFLPFLAVFPFLAKNAPLARKDETGQKPHFEQNFEQFPKRGSIGKNKNEKISKKWPFFETTPQNTTSQKIMHKCIFERAPQISQNWPFSTPFLTCFWPKNLDFFQGLHRSRKIGFGRFLVMSPAWTKKRSKNGHFWGPQIGLGASKLTQMCTTHDYTFHTFIKIFMFCKIFYKIFYKKMKFFEFFVFWIDSGAPFSRFLFGLLAKIAILAGPLFCKKHEKMRFFQKQIGVLGNFVFHNYFGKNIMKIRCKNYILWFWGPWKNDTW